MLTMNVLNGLYRSKKGCTPVCLFGRPDPVEDEKMFEEAMMLARDNFINRWNFDVYSMKPANREKGLKWELIGPRAACENRGVAVDNVNINVVVAEDTDRLVDMPGSARLKGDDETARSRSGIEASTSVSRAVRYSPYDKQQKLTDIWRKRKPASLSIHNSNASKTYEDCPDLISQTSSSTV